MESAIGTTATFRAPSLAGAKAWARRKRKDLPPNWKWTLFWLVWCGTWGLKSLADFYLNYEASDLILAFAFGVLFWLYWKDWIREPYDPIQRLHFAGFTFVLIFVSVIVAAV